MSAFRKSVSLQRLNERIAVNDPSAILLTSDFAEGIVVNFSGSGISLNFENPLARGSRVIISLDSPNGRLRPALLAHGIGNIEAEVRWNYQSAIGFTHGLGFQNFSKQKAEAFVRLVSEFAFGSLKEKNDADELDKLVGS